MAGIYAEVLMGRPKIMSGVPAVRDGCHRYCPLLSFRAYKLGTMIKVSEELLNDSVFDLQSYISREFARRIGAREEEAFFNGDGS